MLAVDASTSRVPYLLLQNPKPNNNLGPILRCAAAYGVKTVLAVGYSKCSVEGSHGASKHVEILAFPTVDQALKSLGADRNSIDLIGLLGGSPVKKDEFSVYEDPDSGLAEILGDDKPNIDSYKSVYAAKSYKVSSWPFDESKIQCFAICKMKRGLSLDLARQCNKFIHIPHRNMGRGFGHGPILDVPSCLSIVLHHYSEWASRNERNFDGHKFELERSHQQAIDQSEARRSERQEKKQKLLDEVPSEQHASVAAFFGNDAGAEAGDY